MFRFWKRKERPLKARCMGCGQEYEFECGEGRFHRLAELPPAQTDGELIVHGRSDRVHAFIYCEECDKTLSKQRKRDLVWRLCCQSFGEADALASVERAKYLCMQIDQGL